MIRVPLLLQTSLAVIYRLSPSSTANAMPYTGVTGYDKDFQEPRTFDQQGVSSIMRRDARVELPPIKVPCQFEIPRFEDLEQKGAGAHPDTVLTLVLHRSTLEEMGLIEATGECAIKTNDRVSAIEYGAGSEREGQILLPLHSPGVYVRSVSPGSIGFGNGFDLYIAECQEREVG